MKVNQYIPNPIRCFKCQKFGHFNSACTHPDTCGKCGQTDHEEDASTNPVKCINCGADHHARSNNCPKWIEEKSIQKIKVENGLSYFEAKKRVTLTNSLNFSQAVKSKKTASMEVQTELTWINGSKPVMFSSVIKKNQVPVTNLLSLQL